MSIVKQYKARKRNSDEVKLNEYEVKQKWGWEKQREEYGEIPRERERYRWREGQISQISL